MLGLDIDREALAEIAGRCRGTPRIANRLLRRVRDYALVHGGQADVAAGRARRSTSTTSIALGLDRLDRAVMMIILTRFGGGPVGLNTLAVAVGEEAETIEAVVEPFLVRIGLITRTPAGRVATPCSVAALRTGAARVGHRRRSRSMTYNPEASASCTLDVRIAHPGRFHPMVLELWIDHHHARRPGGADLLHVPQLAQAPAGRPRDPVEVVPGAKVMTNFGVFGTILSIDEEENQVQLESTPGTVLTVHRQTIARVIDAAEVEAAPRGRRRGRARVR